MWNSDWIPHSGGKLGVYRSLLVGRGPVPRRYMGSTFNAAGHRSPPYGGSLQLPDKLEFEKPLNSTLHTPHSTLHTPLSPKEVFNDLRSNPGRGAQADGTVLPGGRAHPGDLQQPVGRAAASAGAGGRRPVPDRGGTETDPGSEKAAAGKGQKSGRHGPLHPAGGSHGADPRRPAGAPRRQRRL